MRKTIFCIMLAVVFSSYQATAATVLADFEDGGIIPSFIDDGKAFSQLGIVTNPDIGSSNGSAKVFSGTTTSSSWWAGVKLTLNQSVTVSDATRYLHILTKTALQEFELVFSTSGGEKWAGKFTVPATGWFDYVLDLYNLQNVSLQNLTITDIRVTCHVDQSVNQGKSLILDEMLLSNSPDPRISNSSTSNGSISIDCGTIYQTIEGFAASDCWMGNFVGKWSDTPRNNAAKWLFSQNIKTSDDSPEGIGLSIWRVNLGAGTEEQGDASGITGDNRSRRAECFLNPSGNYDWTKQSGQQFFMQKAKEYGCESLVLFSNSPPVSYTRNGKGYSDGDGNANLQTDKYDDFAEYIANVTQYFTNTGYNISYVSPVNEPQWSWNGKGQEGSPWQSSEIKNLVVELNKSLTQRNLNTKILLPEAAEYRYLTSMSSSRAGNQIYQFFDSGSSNYVGNLPAVEHAIAGHSYNSHGTNSDLQNVRTTVKNKADQYGLRVHQTEWSLLGDNPGENFPGYDNASYMDIALILARIIHADLTYANISSWSFWTAMDMERWGHKNRFLLLSVTPSAGVYGDVTQSGTVTASSTLWALGNYSFFIRPGYQRIQLSGANNLAGLMGSAYLAPDKSRVVIVYVNMASSAQVVTTRFANLPESTNVLTNKVYITNSSYNLRKYGGSSSETYTSDKEISIPARSVATVVYELGTLNAVTNINQISNSVEIYPNPATATSLVNLVLPCSKFTVISIYSLDGRLIYSEKQHDTNGNIVVQLPANVKRGLYLVKAQCDNLSFSNKLIIN